MPLLGRDVSVHGPFPDGLLLLESLVGLELLGVPFNFDLGLLSKDPQIQPELILGKPMCIAIRLDTGGERFLHGIVTDVWKSGTIQAYTCYRARLRPRLATLDHTCECRVFYREGQTALDIIKTVLADRGLTDVEYGGVTNHEYRARDFCVQYRESDLHFVQRLLEEEGLYYFWLS